MPSLSQPGVPTGLSEVGWTAPDDPVQVPEPWPPSLPVQHNGSAPVKPRSQSSRPDGGDPQCLGVIFAANVWATIFPLRTTNVSVPRS